MYSLWGLYKFFFWLFYNIYCGLDVVMVVIWLFVDSFFDFIFRFFFDVFWELVGVGKVLLLY